MIGTQTAPAQLFYDCDLERNVPSGDMLRSIDWFLDMDGMQEAIRPFYSHIGRPSTDPELIPGCCSSGKKVPAMRAVAGICQNGLFI